MRSKLESKHIDYIKSDLLKREISYETLLNELVDHLACEVELQMQLGKDFQQAYQYVLVNNDIASLSGLEEETIKSINSGFSTMKKLYTVPLILLALTLITKFLRLPFPGILALLTLLSLSVIQGKIGLDFLRNRQFRQMNLPLSFLTFTSIGLNTLGSLNILMTGDLQPGVSWIASSISLFTLVGFIYYFSNHLQLKNQAIQLIITSLYLFIAVRFTLIHYAHLSNVFLPAWFTDNSVFTPVFVLIQLIVFIPVILYKGLYRNQHLTTLVLSSTIITTYLLPF